MKGMAIFVLGVFVVFGCKSSSGVPPKIIHTTEPKKVELTQEQNPIHVVQSPAEKVPLPNFQKLIGTWVDRHDFFLKIEDADGNIKISAWDERVFHEFEILNIMWDGENLVYVLHNLTINLYLVYQLHINERGNLVGTWTSERFPSQGGKIYRKVR